MRGMAPSLIVYDITASSSEQINEAKLIFAQKLFVQGKSKSKPIEIKYFSYFGNPRIWGEWPPL